jgi:putative MATE family efflux protein
MTATAAAITAPPANPILSAPILGTIIRLSTPNMMAMVATCLVAIAETVYVGLLGIPALAGMALVFPMVMLQQMMSAGAMGGGVSSAVSRALGAGDLERARSLAFHTLVIGLAGGLGVGVIFLTLGPSIYRLLGGQGEALTQALIYSNVVFAGALSIWLCNLLASVLRGMGNMTTPSTALLAVAALQIVLGGSLGLGLGPMPRLGMVGVGLGQVVAYGLGAIWFFWYLRSGKARFTLPLSGVRLRRDHAWDILRVGAIACLSSFQSVLTVLILTRLVARFGDEALAGYGIGSRLEFLLVPVTFAIGVSLVPMVGMAIGAGNAPRARRAAWTGGLLAFLTTGVIGLIGWLLPEAWARLFTDSPGVVAAARSYLVWVGPTFGFYGLGLCLYFAAQGAGRVMGPVLTGTLRLAVIALGGWWLVATDQPAWTMFALVGVAMVAYGIATAYVIHLTRWGRAG